MTTLQRMCLVCLLVAFLASLGSTPARATTTNPFSCRSGSWSIVSSPNPFPLGDNLEAVAAVSATDVWAVGYGVLNDSSEQALIEHWNGSQWQAISSPMIRGSQLYGIAALSATNAWAVGFSLTSGKSLIEHWNGTQWQVIASPNIGPLDQLDGVAALSANDIWAVGSYSSVNSSPTLIEHWTGHAWKIVASPSVGIYDNLTAIADVSPTDLWAVGWYTPSRYHVRSFSEHWDGHHWQIIPTPGGNLANLNAVTVVNAHEVWAVGVFKTNATLTTRWNGHTWRRMPSPASGLLYGVAVRRGNQLWAVGSTVVSTLTEQWNGSQWSIVPSPSIPNYDNILSGVAVLTPQTAWAVGYYSQSYGNPGQTLIEYYC